MTYTFTYKIGRSFKSASFVADDIEDARARFEDFRPARSHLMQVSAH